MKRLTVLTAALCLAAAAPAFGAPTWLEPVTLSGGTAQSPVVGLGSGGDAAAAWQLGGRIEARVRAPGGPFGAVQIFGTSGSNSPVVGVADDGTAILAWAQGSSIGYAIRAPGGGFGGAQEMPAGGAVSSVRLDVNPAGGALLAFVRDERAYGTYRPPGGGFEPPQPVSACVETDSGIDAALGDGGHQAIAWRDCSTSGSVRVARRAPGAGWAAPDGLTASTEVAVAVAPDGTTGVVWIDPTRAARAATAAPGSNFGTSLRLSEELADTPSATAAGSELWAGLRTSNGAVLARRMTGGSTLVATEAGNSPMLEGASDGSLLAAWLRDVGSDTRVEATRRAPGVEGFGSVDLVSAAGSDAATPWPAVDSMGNGAVAYLRGGLAAVRVLDASGPRIGTLALRNGGFAQEDYEFPLDLHDAWSAVSSSAIDFGDGTAAPGPSPRHTYATAGERTLTLTATDSLGNVSTVKRPFVVGPALDRTAPVITNLRMDSTRFRVTRKETAVASAVARGTRFRYTLSEPAQANIYFERVGGSGRLRGGECQRGARSGRRCRVYVPVALITRRHLTAGNVSVGFSGRIVVRNGALKVADITFKPGRYRATITAADTNRNVSKPQEIGFTVRR